MASFSASRVAFLLLSSAFSLFSVSTSRLSAAMGASAMACLAASIACLHSPVASVLGRYERVHTVYPSEAAILSSVSPWKCRVAASAKSESVIFFLHSVFFSTFRGR